MTLRRSTDLVGEMKQSLDLLLVATSALAQALSTLSYPDKEEGPFLPLFLFVCRVVCVACVVCCVSCC